MTPDAASRDIALAQRTLASIHPGYLRYASAEALVESWDELQTRAARGISRESLYVEISRILAAIRCGHTKAELPKDIAKRRDSEATYLPFHFVLLNRRMYIEQVDRGGPLTRGQEVVAIDGRSIEDWLAAVEPLVPVDGDANHAKAVAIAGSTEFIGPALDHFAPLLFPIGGTASVRVRGVKEAVSVARRTYPAFLAIAREERFAANFASSVRFDRIGKDGAYLAVDTFINYRNTVDAVAHLAPHFAALKTEGRTKLIVDLRRNGGGSTDAEIALLRHLITRPTQHAEAVLTRFNSLEPAIKRHLDTWEKAALDPDPAWFAPAPNGFYRLVAREAGAPGGPLAPADNAFAGDLVVLIGPGNASGSTHFAAVLKAAGRATLVGERTGGAPTGATAGILFTLTLPESGIRIRVPAQRTVIANSARLPSRNGLTPDISVPQTPEAYFADRDLALEAARSHLGL